MGLFRPRKPLSPLRRVTRVLVWMTLVVVVWMRWTMPPVGSHVRAKQYAPVAPLPKDLYRVEIKVSLKDYQTLLGYHWNGWQGGGERPEVKVTVREGGVTYTEVALHPKGSAGSFRPFNNKPAMTLNFSKHKKGQTFHGYSKISLNNSVQDSTYLSEAICREMFVEAGVPAPRVEHATVVVNGQDLGLYVLSEGWGKPFLRRHFKNVDGNLFDSGFVRDITEDLEVNSGDDKDSRADLDRLVEASSEPVPAKRWERLNEVLDMERFITFVAMEVLTCHWDGYALNRNNYRVFHDRSTGKMVFLPHGLDQTFGVGRSSPNSSIQPGMGGLVARAAIGTPMGRKLYLERIASLRATVFQEEKLTNRLWELARRLQPTLAAYSPDAASFHAAMVTDFAERIGERARSVSEQLASPQQPLTFNEAGVARVTGWRRIQSRDNPGAAQLDRETTDDGALLRIRMSEAGGVASWRSRVTLESGVYRFEGRVKTKGVGTSGGVSLRFSGARVPPIVLEDDEWALLSFGLQVEDILTEVELICELRSSGGEAWFDEGSLTLVRAEP
jgi:hypothetical protein